MEVLISLIAIVFGILQIVLFFKIWGMTNDVKDIADYLINGGQYNVTHSATPVTEVVPQGAMSDGVYSVDQLVVLIKTEDQLKIKRIHEDGKYECNCITNPNLNGTYSKDEIMDFDLYWSQKKRR